MSIRVVEADRPIDGHSHPSFWRDAWASDPKLTPTQVIDAVEQKLGRRLREDEIGYVLQPAVPHEPTFWEKIQSAQERAKGDYGEIELNADSVGLLITGILQAHYGIKLPHSVPGHVAMLICAQRKSIRLAKPGYREDDGIDACSYVELADRLKRKGEGTK